MIVCSVSVYCVSGAMGLFLIFYLDQFLIVLEYVLISFLVFVCIFFFHSVDSLSVYVCVVGFLISACCIVARE